MKNIIFYILLLIGFVSHSQNPVSFGATDNNFKSYNFTVDPLPKYIFKNSNSLSIYNPMIQMYDNYTGFDGNYYMNNVKSFSFYSPEGGIRADSLNPYGSTTIGNAVANGVFGFLGLDIFIYEPPRE